MKTLAVCAASDGVCVLWLKDFGVRYSRRCICSHVVLILPHQVLESRSMPHPAPVTQMQRKCPFALRAHKRTLRDILLTCTRSRF